MCETIGPAISWMTVEPMTMAMTRSDTGLPVIKVLVPGLRHFWRRLAPGRLYDVPVRIGRLDRPLDEKALNPISLFV